MASRQNWPPAIGRADLVRAGLDHTEADRDLADWFGFKYRLRVTSPTLEAEQQAGSETAHAEETLTLADGAADLREVILCRKYTTFSRDSTSESSTPPTAGTTRWLNRPERPPRFFPLSTGQRIKNLLDPLLDQSFRLGSVDLRRVVGALARARPLTNIPRREKPFLVHALQCVADRSTRLTPFWQDQALVVAQIRELFPHLDLYVWVFEEAARTFTAVTDETPEALDPTIGPLLVLGDLGAFSAAEERTMWRTLARSFVFEGGRAGALLPCYGEEVSLAELGPWEVLQWEGDVWLPVQERDIERLMTFASAAIRLEPGLLRALRKQIMPATSASLEIAVWNHPAISSRSVEAASFDADLRVAYHRRLAKLSEREPDAVTTSIGAIREWRQICADEVWYEEILGLPKVIRDDPRFVDPLDVATANAFFASLRQGAARGDLSSGEEAWLARAGRRQQRDGLWQNAHAGAAMKAVLQSDPDFIPPVIVDTEPDREDWHANIAFDNDGGLWLSSGALSGQSLGTIAMRDGDIEIVAPDKNGPRIAAGRLTADGAQLRLDAPKAPFVVLSSRGAMEVGAAVPSELRWASVVASDRIGPWADLTLSDATLRFRWIPPGRGIVGLGPQDVAARELYQSDASPRQTEIVFSHGFWLMERPVIRHEVDLVLGQQAGGVDEIEALPAVDLSIDDVTLFFERVRDLNWDARLRLPTQIEWEYACRARIPDETTYAGTPDLANVQDKTLSTIAWFQPTEAMLDAWGRQLQQLARPLPPMRKRSNPWGLYDMLGNVAEWCIDSSSLADEMPVKGGSFRHGPAAINAAHVEHLSAASRFDWVGFRPAIGRSEIESLRIITPPRRQYIQRSRAPRVQIDYDVEHYGSPTTIALPFVMGVMADLAGDSETREARNPIGERRFVETDAERFPTTMEALAPRVKARVPNRLPGNGGEEPEKELFLDLTFKSMDDFAPDRMAEQVPSLAELMTMRRRLEELLGYLDGRAEAEKRIAQLLSNGPLLAQIAGQATQTLTTDEAPINAEAHEQTAAGAGEVEALDSSELRELLEKDFRVEEAESDKFMTLLQNLVLAATATPGEWSRTEVISGSGIRSIRALIAGIDEALTAQMNELLHAPEVREIEGNWRGLYYLVNNTETDQNLKIRVMNIKKDELADHLEDYEGQMWDQADLFKRIYSDEYSMFGGEPFGAIVGAYEFSHHPKDVGLLRNISEICAAAHAPFIAAAAPALFRMESWQELPNPQDLQQIVSSPDYASWQSLRESEDSRYIGLTMPRVLARLPYGAATVPVKGFAFEEEIRGDHNRYVWMNAAFAMGVNINRSHKLYGWGTQIRGVESGGIVINLPVHTFPTDDGSVAMKCPTEIALDDRREAELAKLGLMPILHRKNTDVAAFISAHSLQDDEARASRLVDPDAQANERLSANLQYLLPACRFAHYLKALARDKIGTFKEKADMQRWLSEWINRYVLANPAISDDTARARRPLARAEIHVLDEVEGRPGYYNAHFYLRPHYQLEGINGSLRLVSELPSVKVV